MVSRCHVKARLTGAADQNKEPHVWHDLGLPTRGFNSRQEKVRKTKPLTLEYLKFWKSKSVGIVMFDKSYNLNEEFAKLRYKIHISNTRKDHGHKT